MQNVKLHGEVDRTFQKTRPVGDEISLDDDQVSKRCNLGLPPRGRNHLWFNIQRVNRSLAYLGRRHGKRSKAAAKIDDFSIMGTQSKPLKSLFRLKKGRPSLLGRHIAFSRFHRLLE
jgi:hypothetical protein